MRSPALIALATGLLGFASFAEAQGAGAAAASATSATAAPKAVVELFTSQGCSSCPAADALLTKLAAERDDIIPITLSVDYWDYLGWKDTLADEKFTERQKAYAKTLGSGMVYTPQLVVNGVVQLNGADEHKVAAAIDKVSATNVLAQVPVRISSLDDKIKVEIGAAPQGSQPKEATVWLAVISPKVDVPITRGENKGKTVTYTNVVRELIPVGTWNGEPAVVKLPRHSLMPAGARLCAVIVQEGRGGPIVGAAVVKHSN